MTRQYFGTDGVRGRVGEYPIVPEFAMKLGWAAGRILARRRVTSGDRPAVLIGKDTRVSGYMLEAALEAGFSAAGVDVWLAGPMPTPAIAYLTRTLRLSAGVVISASHNPYEDNGIKFFSGDGTKLPDEVELQIESWLDRPMSCEPSAGLGKAKRVNDAEGRYIEFCKSSFPNELSLHGLRVVVDSAHGACYHIAKHVFHELGADVISIGDQPNGFNINDGVGATHGETLSRAVREHRADVGIALDGDGDRLLMADRTGRVYNGDELLYVIVRDRLRQGPVAGVAGTLMTNVGLELAFKRLGVPFGRAKVGDRYVMEMLTERGWQLGGESSGHLLCLDRHSTGDGIVSALQVLTALQRSGLALAGLVEDLQMYPQKMINVQIPAGFAWQQHQALLDEQARITAALGDGGRILIRASGTEPVLRVMVEAANGHDADAYAHVLAETLPKVERRVE